MRTNTPIQMKDLLSGELEGPSVRPIIRQRMKLDNPMEYFLLWARKFFSPKFEIDDNNEYVISNFLKWILADDSFECDSLVDGELVGIKGDLRKGILIAGSTGTGKSWIMNSMLKFTAQHIVPVYINQWKCNLAAKMARADEITDDYVATGDLDHWKKADILCIQDMGAEPRESLYMGNRVNVIEQLIGYRGDRLDQITFVTTNYDIHGEAFRSRYGERTASRLPQMCNIFILTGEDRRLRDG